MTEQVKRTRAVQGRGWSRAAVLLALLIPGATAVRGATIPDLRLPSTALHSPGSFAFGDFDGDRQADFAEVRTGSTSPVAGNYWIDIRLSTTGEQHISLAVPAGGLSIEARDVDGDDDLDLIVTTAWVRKPVAVLINDGRGHFSRAEPSAFPGALIRQDLSWESAPGYESELIATPANSRSRLAASKAARIHCYDFELAALLPCSNSKLAICPVLSSSASRAPPFAESF